MGHGNLNADIVCIGEAPGKKEDETGLPFQGAAGRFLNTMLEASGLDRGNVYITNIVKYRPPNNRDPKPAEKKTFLPYLLEELTIIQPKVVITLGRHSMEYFLLEAAIADVHGTVHHVTLNNQTIVVAPLYHPAAALYNGSLRQTAINDFQSVIHQVSARSTLSS
jgi:uracil-DNA glycosylase